MKELAAQVAIINFAAFIFMVPLGLQFAVSGLVGNLLGEKNSKQAKRIAVITMAVCFVYEVVVIALLNVFSLSVSGWFTNDPETSVLILDCLPTLSCLVMFDGLNGAVTGVVRALGKQGIISLIFLCCFYLVAIPTAVLLGFYLEWGLKGFWAGFIFALVMLNIIVARICVKADWVAEYVLRDEGPGCELLPLISKS